MLFNRGSIPYRLNLGLISKRFEWKFEEISRSGLITVRDSGRRPLGYPQKINETVQCSTARDLLFNGTCLPLCKKHLCKIFAHEFLCTNHLFSIRQISFDSSLLLSPISQFFKKVSRGLQYCVQICPKLPTSFATTKTRRRLILRVTVNFDSHRRIVHP